jgi:peptide/nickel transport system permease protein
VQGGITLAVLSVVLFRLLVAVPGNAVELMVQGDPSVSPRDVARLARLRGLDQPWSVQFTRWLWGHHPPREPPVFPGPARRACEPGQPLAWDVGPLVRGQDGPTVTLHGVEPGTLVDGTVVRVTCPREDGRVVLLVARDEVGLESPVVLVLEAQPGAAAPLDVTWAHAVPGRPFAFTPVLPGGETLLAVRLVAGSGRVEGVTYRHRWDGPGQEVVTLEVEGPTGTRRLLPLVVDHGPLPDPTRFRPGFLLGSLGYSAVHKRPVADLLEGRVSSTLALMLPVLLLSLLLALPLGVVAAVRHRRWPDRLVSALTFLGTSFPVFWLGILAIMVLAVQWRWFPAGGAQTPGVDTLGDKAFHLVLPVLVLCVPFTCRWVRHVRSAMLEALAQDHLRTARAYGLTPAQVVLRHALRNALVPVATVVMLSLPAVFSGALLTETVFAWPGLGRLVYESVLGADHYVAMVAFLLSAALVVVCNLAADAACVALDPRARSDP